MKVLIAEDNPMWRQLLEKNATRYGFEPIGVEDGEKAWEILRKKDAPRLVVLDWQMPGLDGIEVCRRIKRDDNRPFTYVVILTSRDAKEDMVAGLDAGADDYLTKPVDAAVLRSRLTAAKRIVEAIPPPEWSKPQVKGYNIKRLIGKGAFATVWEAVHEESGNKLALKLLRVDLATEQVFSRFAREIQVMQRLDHPHVAHVYDSDINDTLGYIAMDLIEGKTLDQFVRDEKPGPVELIELMASVCRGLHHGHGHGVIHRDLKPSNIMLDANRQPKIVDFGLCKSMFGPKSAEDSAESIDGLVIGSPLFLAPEQARAENSQLDGRCDVFSAGIVLYMMLLRRHPLNLKNDDRREVIAEMAQGHVQPPHTINPKFSKTLERIMMKALALDPDDRYATAQEFADDLQGFVDERRASKRKT